MNWTLHHVNIATHDVRGTVAFYRDVIGLDGVSSWPVVENGGSFNKNDDYVMNIGDGYHGLHIVKPVPGLDRQNGLLFNPSMGGHFAVTVPDLDKVCHNLDKAGVLYSRNSNTFMGGMRNMYLYDPAMNFFEVNQKL